MCGVPPVEYARSDEREPPRRFTLGRIGVKPCPPRERRSLPPRAIRLPSGAHHIDRLNEPWIGWCPLQSRHFSEVVERHQRAVPVAIQIHELRDEVADEIAGRRPAQEAPCEQVLFAAVARLAESGVARKPLVSENAAKGVER